MFPAPATLIGKSRGLFVRFGRVAAAVAFARVLTLAAIVAGLAAALAFTIVLALAVVLAFVAVIGELAERGRFGFLRVRGLRGVRAGDDARHQAGHRSAGQQYLGAS